MEILTSRHALEYNDIVTDLPEYSIIAVGEVLAGERVAYIPDEPISSYVETQFGADLVVVGSFISRAVVLDLGRKCAGGFKHAKNLFTLRLLMLPEQRVVAQIKDASVLLWRPDSPAAEVVTTAQYPDDSFLHLVSLTVSNDGLSVYLIFIADREHYMMQYPINLNAPGRSIPVRGHIQAVDGDTIIYQDRDANVLVLPIFKGAKPLGPYPEKCSTSKPFIKDGLIYQLQLSQTRLLENVCIDRSELMNSLTSTKGKMLAEFCKAPTATLREEIRTGLPCSDFGLRMALESIVLDLDSKT
jgi:hypothetical protein